MKDIYFKSGCKYRQKKQTWSEFTGTTTTTCGAVIISLCLITVSFGSKLDNKTSANLISVSRSFVKVKKCCPLNEYFNVAKGVCELWPKSKSVGTRRSFVNRESTTEKITREWDWEPPAKFYSRFSNHKQVILRFDSNSIGNPECWNGKFENFRTEVVELPKEEEWNKNSNVTWDWENEINYYFFVPGSQELVEVTTGEPHKETYHNPDHFCVDLTTTELILRICGCSDHQPCIRKCCPLGHHLNIGTDDNASHICVKDNILSDDPADHWEIPLHSKPHVLLSKEERQRLKPRYVVSQLSCTSMSMTSGWSINNVEQGTFIVYQNGSPQYYDPKKQTWSFLTTGSDHCFDRLIENSSNEVCPGEPEVMVFCLDEGFEETQSYHMIYTMYVVALAIATVLLLLTAVVVSMLIEKNNIHSWTRLAYILSHFIFFFLVGLTHLQVVTPSNKYACFAMAVVIHWIGLVTACWLSLINFDLWWTFKVLKPKREHELDIQRFLWYILFAFGLPTMIVAIALGIQSQEPEFICRSNSHIKRPIAPHYADDRSCTMSEIGRPAYWFGPLVILLVANLIFFCITTCRMMGLQRMTRRASIESTSSGQTQSRQIFIKIFVVSGVTWWVEIIQWTFSHDLFAWYELLLDMIHFFQAVAIFVIVVCKRDVIRNLQIKYPVITKVIPPVSRLQRSGTIGSISADPNSRSLRIVNKVDGRKMSTTSTASSAAAGADGYRRQESFELPTSSDSFSIAPATISIPS